MKRKTMIVLILIFTAAVLSASDGSGGNIGLQFSSDTNLQFLFRGEKAEGGLGVQAFLGDGTYVNQGVLGINGYAAYRFGSGDTPFGFTLGVEGGTVVGLEDVEYDEYINIGPRLGFNYDLGSRFRVSGILYPLWLSTREIADVEDTWGLQVFIPKASVAVAFFF